MLSTHLSHECRGTSALRFDSKLISRSPRLLDRACTPISRRARGHYCPFGVAGKSRPVASAAATQNTQKSSKAARSRHVPIFADLQAVATSRGMHLSLKTLGPGYRIVCRDGDANGSILATTSGFVVPLLKLMHCDTMQVFTPRLAEADRDRIRGGSFFGLSLLIVAAIMSHGHTCGCVKAEMLAINDDDYQHARLVKYYARLGFEEVVEVGNRGLADLPHLLVWGGAGTRMNINPEQFLCRWMPVLQRGVNQDSAAPLSQ